MGIENLPPHVPPQGTADDHLRREMLLGPPPSSTHSAGHAIGQQLGEGTGIFMRNDTCNRPTHRTRRERERVPAHKETSRAGTDKRPLSSSYIFERFRVQERAKGGF